MKMFDTIKIILVSLILGIGFSIVGSTIIASKMFPDGKSGNQYIDFLLSNITIQTVIEDDYFQKKYPYEQNIVEKYEDKIAGFKKSIESFCTVSFPGSTKIDSLVTKFRNEIYHYHIDEISSLHEKWEYVKEPVENVINFKQELENENIPFLYVQTPAPETIQYYKGENITEIAQRSYALTYCLEKSGINLINIPKDNNKDVWFDQTSHWFPKDALMCAQIVAKELNEKYGFEIDNKIYELNNYENLLDKYEDIKGIIENDLGNSYEVLIPKNNNEYKFDLIHAESVQKTGAFSEVMLKDENEWEYGEKKIAYYNIFEIDNSLIYDITNYNVSNDKKILIIGDSFNWSVAPYLSLGLKEVTIIHNATFNGSIMSWVRQNEPDIVVMIYNDAELYEVYTKDAFNLK